MSTMIPWYGAHMSTMPVSTAVPVNTMLVNGLPFCVIVPAALPGNVGAADASEPVSFAVPAAAREALQARQVCPVSQRRSHGTREEADAPIQLGRLSVHGQVWALSRDARGSRVIQEAVEVSRSDEDSNMLSQELHGHVWEAVCCPHANHVLQKCIVKMRPKHSQFIIDELVEQQRVEQAARHKYGCRVLQRILEHCRSDQVDPIMQKLLAEGVALSRHNYGCYVMQHVLEHGDDKIRQNFMELLLNNAAVLGADGFACGVIHKALVLSDSESGLQLARALIKESGLIVRMARGRRGHLAVKAIWDLLEEGSNDRVIFMNQLQMAEEMLRGTRYGRSVVGQCSRHGTFGDNYSFASKFRV